MFRKLDRINHEILLRKIETAGIMGNLLKWVRSYLSDRMQFVQIGKQRSKTERNETGVPQGSILGPLLFIIFINDLCEMEIDGQITTYADDTAVTFAASNMETLLKKSEMGMSRIIKWFNFNRLNINIKKTKFLIYQKYNLDNLNYKIKLHVDSLCEDRQDCICDGIERVTSYKYLGIVMDQNLKWDIQIKNVCNRLRLMNHRFYRLRNIVDKNFKYSLYHAWVGSILNYSIVFMGSAYYAHLGQLISIHRRIVNNMNLNNNYLGQNSEKSIFTINQLSIFHLLKFINSNWDFYERRIKNRNTRNVNTSYKVITPNWEIIRNSHIFKGPLIFGQLELFYGNSVFMDKEKFAEIARKFVVEKF